GVTGGRLERERLRRPEDAVAAADGGFIVDRIGEAETRAQLEADWIVGVTWVAVDAGVEQCAVQVETGDLRVERIFGVLVEADQVLVVAVLRGGFVLAAEAEVEGQSRVHAPVVLNE